MNKSYFGYISFAVPALIPRKSDFQGEFIFFYAVAGTVEASLDGSGGWFPVVSGLKFRFKVGERFNAIYFRSTAGGTVNYYYGAGDVSNETPATIAAGAAQIVVGVVADPNGVHVPVSTLLPAIYYQDDAAINFWIWSVAGQIWLPMVT